MFGRYIWGLILVAIGLSFFFPEILSSQAIKVVIAAALILTGLRIIFFGYNGKSKK